MPPTIVDALLPDSLAGVNFAYGRGECPFPIDVIVIHVTEGDAASVRSWFKNPEAEVSSHYMVTKAGTIVRFVAEANKAFHAGQLVGPTAKLVRQRHAQGGWTPNSYGIGVEHEGSGREELTDAQRAASYALLADIIQRRSIPIDRDHIIGHHEVKALKTCPGAISVDRIVMDLMALQSGLPTQPSPSAITNVGRVVWSNVLKDFVVVVRYESDTKWWYRTLKSLDNADAKLAGSPLSAMPTAPGVAA